VVAGKGPLTGGELDRLLVATATALAAIHRGGIVHRDFKPQNVVLGPDGPRVIDFGIARVLDATSSLTSQAIGTPAFMAPEQLTGAQVGPEADVFAWGRRWCTPRRACDRSAPTAFRRSSTGC
jgi:serine/threonine protein kinase